MASKRRRTNKPRRTFRIRARGVHHPTADIARLTRASLEHYLATQETATPTSDAVPIHGTSVADSSGETTAGLEEQSDDAA